MGRALFIRENGKCILKPHYGIEPASCNFSDFLIIKKFDFYFSRLKTLICDNWEQLGKRFLDQGISREKFISCMEDLNAGRTDADIMMRKIVQNVQDWEIDNQTMQAFRTAYETLDRFF